MNSIEEKKKLLNELLDIIKSYSDHVEREFYLKEISHNLELSDKLVIDSYNNIRYKRSDSEKEINNIKKETSSADLAIAYSLLGEKYMLFLKENLAFYNFLKWDLKEIFENWAKKIESFELSKKEKYRALALKLELDNEGKNEDNIIKDIKILARLLDEEIYNREKIKFLSSKDEEDLIKYMKLNQIAKKAWIK